MTIPLFTVTPNTASPLTFASDMDTWLSEVNAWTVAANDLAVAMGVSGGTLGAGVATFLATPSSANLLAAVTNKTGSGALVFAVGPTLVSPQLGTPTSGVLTNCTGTAAGLTAGLATAANGLKTDTTTVSISAATAPTAGQVLVASSSSLATWSNTPVLTGTNFSGTAASLTAGSATAANGLRTATTTVSISAATAPTAGQVLVASSTTLAAWATLSATLNNVAAASSSATIANGNNPITWNWTQTTASQTAFSIGETSASTGGSGSQVMCKIGTLASSTADPLQVTTRGVDTIRISRTGDVTVTALNGTAGSGTTGGAVSITGGTGATGSNNGGAITITGGTGGSAGGVGGAVTISSGPAGVSQSGNLTLQTGAAGAGKSGDISIFTGASSSGAVGSISIYTTAQTTSSPSNGITLTVGNASYFSGQPLNMTAGSTAGSGGGIGNGGSINITAGAQTASGDAGTGVGGSVTITAGASASTSAGSGGGSVNLVAGASTGSKPGGDIAFTPGTGTAAGRVRFNNSSSANGAVATVLGSVGPTGASTTVQEWLTVKVGANLRYIPCF